jgi:tetratricopeptide (TPR) repeat protein
MADKVTRRQKNASVKQTRQETANAAVVTLGQVVADELNGNIASALAKLEFSGLENTSVDLLAALGHLLLQTKRFDEAQKAFSQLISSDPSLETAHFHLGVCLDHQGDFEGALAAFGESQKLSSDRFDAELAIANCLLNLNRLDEAYVRFEKCYETRPDDENALLGRAVTLQLKGNADEASEVCKLLLQRASASSECLTNLTILGLQNKDFGLVRVAAERISKLDPNSEIALEGFGAVAFAAEEFLEAAKYFERLVELYPDNYDHWLNLAVARHRLGRLDSATETYQKALQIRPDGTAAYVNLGLLYQETGQSAQAVAALEQARRIDPDRDDIRYHTAVALEETGEAEKAAGIYETLVQTNPDMTNAWFRLGTIRLKSEDFKQAAEAFKNCIDLRPEWTEAEINFAIACSKQQEHEQAQGILESALLRKPDSVEIVRALAMFALDQRQSDRALKYHLRLIELGDKSAEVRHNLGLLYHDSGDLKKAMAEYEYALLAKPDFAEALLNLGNALKVTGKDEAARNHWVRALEIKPELALGYFLQ